MNIAIGFSIWIIVMAFFPKKILKAIRKMSLGVATLLLLGVVVIPVNIWVIGMVFLLLTVAFSTLFDSQY